TRPRPPAKGHRGPDRKGRRVGGPQRSRSHGALAQIASPLCGEVLSARRALRGGESHSPRQPSRVRFHGLDTSVPRHIGIIMDGNGRWARRRGHPASFGHRAGVRAIKRVLDGCEQLGVHTLSVYAFSTENWSRPRAEVRALMRLFHETMQREIDEMPRRGVRIVVSGRRDGLSPRMRQRIDESIALTSKNTKGVLNVCLNYGGRAEIVDAVRRLVEEGTPSGQIDEAAIASRLYNPDLP